MDSDPITLVNHARRDLKTVIDLVGNYERTRDEAILSNIVKLSLLIYDNAIKAFLIVKGIRVKDPEHLSQVAHDFMPSGVINNDVKEVLTKCLSQTECSTDIINAEVKELSRLVDYVHSISTHSVIHRGL